MMARWLLAETTPIWRNWGCRGKPHDKKKRKVKSYDGK